MQLACEAGGDVIGTGRVVDSSEALDFGAQEFVDLDNDVLEDVGRVDLVLDVIGGDIPSGPAAPIERQRNTGWFIVGPTEARPADGLVVDFVVEFDRAPDDEIVQRCGRMHCGRRSHRFSALDDAIATFNADRVDAPASNVIRGPMTRKNHGRSGRGVG